MEKLLLGHVRDIFAEEMDGAGVRTEKSIGELEQNAFADAGGAEQDARFIRADRKADIFKHRVIEPDGDIAKFEDRPSGLRDRCAGVGAVEEVGVCHQPKMVSMTWVTRKSTKMMSTEETTTALMVDRPTPSVPPVVRCHRSSRWWQ